MLVFFFYFHHSKCERFLDRFCENNLYINYSSSYFPSMKRAASLNYLNKTSDDSFQVRMEIFGIYLRFLFAFLFVPNLES